MDRLHKVEEAVAVGVKVRKEALELGVARQAAPRPGALNVAAQHIGRGGQDLIYACAWGGPRTARRRSMYHGVQRGEHRSRYIDGQSSMHGEFLRTLDAVAPEGSQCKVID